MWPEKRATSMLVCVFCLSVSNLENTQIFYIQFGFSLELLEKELCRVQARKSFNNGRYGNALEWALRSQDNIYVTSIADLFLRVS